MPAWPTRVQSRSPIRLHRVGTRLRQPQRRRPPISLVRFARNVTQRRQPLGGRRHGRRPHTEMARQLGRAHGVSLAHTAFHFEAAICGAAPIGKTPPSVIVTLRTIIGCALQHSLNRQHEPPQCKCMKIKGGSYGASDQRPVRVPCGRFAPPYGSSIGSGERSAASELTEGGSLRGISPKRRKERGVLQRRLDEPRSHQRHSERSCRLLLHPTLPTLTQRFLPGLWMQASSPALVSRRS